MGFIEFHYTQLVSFFQSVQETQFGAVAGAAAVTGQLLATLVVIVTLVVAASGRGSFSWGDAIKLVFVVGLVALFMQNWADFNVLVSALVAFFDSLRDSFFAGAGVGGEGSFLGELDNVLERALESATTAAGRLDIWGAVQNAFVLFAFGTLSAVALLGMIFSYALLTIAISFAPVAIMCVLSDKTRNYFEKWMDFMVTALIFPVIIAAILGTVIVMMGSAFSIGTDEPTAGIFFPVVASVLTGIILIITTPFVVTALTGNLSLGSLAARGAAIVTAGASRAFGGTVSGLRGAARDTSAYISNQRQFGNEPYQQANRAHALQRQMARAERFTRPRK
ncbi:MAG: type IV secretion system protein [Pseudomonadota bacterium]